MAILMVTREQQAALRAYADAHGTYWKSHLRRAWEAGETTGVLQEIRNVFGPTWLMTYGQMVVSDAREGFGPEYWSA